MNPIALIYFNGFAVLVLLLVLRDYRLKFKNICCEEKAFILFILTTLLILVNETAIENLWGRPGHTIHILLYIQQTTDFALAAAVPMLWLYYSVFRIYHISNVSRRIRYLLALPAALFTVFLLITAPLGIAFRITPDNQYERGAAFFTAYGVGYAYVAAALTLNILKRKTLNRGELVPYLLVPAIPVLWGIVEAVAATRYGLMWAATSLVILEIQMLVLNNRTNIDHLTSLNNRMALDIYVRREIRDSHGTGRRLGLMMIDIDDFKRINDEYGHVEGDRALKATADILRECFSGRYFIARYGGDEFLVVLKECSRELMDNYLGKLSAAQGKHSLNTGKPYRIRFSVGASVFEPAEMTSVHAMLMRVDRMMYEDKNKKKQDMNDEDD